MLPSTSFDTVLIANRGEIAVRIIRTCQENGIRTVAVYSDADRDALHVQLADLAVRIGPAQSSESYLRGETILEAALTSGAQAIHPGYGFLSENAAFARACADAGIRFIGPSPEAIERMGDKTSARELMREAGVPMAPGTPEAISDPHKAKQIASDMGYPVLIKAAAGGGGKGMRVVESGEDFLPAFEMARSEAVNSFGDGRVYLEKYLINPRHIEIQVLADSHGNTVHLFERDCSIQRRHQKVIEEAPSAVLTSDLRKRMGETAVAAARACDYEGAGTVEFLLDSENEFYFLEMNTRLQVEHPVTELITGLDLVAEQIRIARGEHLGYAQEDLVITGHAIECRIYAEDVRNGFIPAPGSLLRHRIPSGPGIRVDAGVSETSTVSVYYDPMISKLITWAKTRESAIQKMLRALSEYDIVGTSTTIPFCETVVGSESFGEGHYTTGYVTDTFEVDDINYDCKERGAAALAMALMFDLHRTNEDLVDAEESRWNSRRRI